MKKKWTGERLETFVYNDTTVEHLHRYGIVMHFIENKTVLDIACGEGYGSKLIAGKASTVYGVDIDPVTIKNAKQKYAAPNLSFLEGSADNIPLKASTVDVVVSFETIEHHDKHEEMMNEIKRVLKPGGILIMSSPEKKSEVSFNEFHVKELSRTEFIKLINQSFRFSKFYSQKIAFGSVIAPIENATGSNFEFEYGGFEHINSYPEIPDHVFNLCIASDEPGISLPISIFDGRDILVENILRPYHNSRLYRSVGFIKKLFHL